MSLFPCASGTLGSNFEAIAQRIGVYPVELDLAAASRSALSAETMTAVTGLTSQAQAAAERLRRATGFVVIRGLDSEELVAGLLSDP